MDLEHTYHNLLSVDRSDFGSKPTSKGKPWDLNADVHFYVSDQLIAMPLPSSQGPESQNPPDSSVVKNELGIKTLAACYAQGQGDKM